MTRPMPGPPEYWWYCTPPHGEPGLCTSDMDPAEYMPFTHLQHKRLTDAECAAEYWRALRDDEWEDYDMLDGYGPPHIDPWGKEWWPRSGIANEDRLNTWRRFARTPHLDADAT